MLVGLLTEFEKPGVIVSLFAMFLSVALLSRWWN